MRHAFFALYNAFRSWNWRNQAHTERKRKKLLFLIGFDFQSTSRLRLLGDPSVLVWIQMNCWLGDWGLVSQQLPWAVAVVVFFLRKQAIPNSKTRWAVHYKDCSRKSKVSRFLLINLFFTKTVEGGKSNPRKPHKLEHTNKLCLGSNQTLLIFRFFDKADV
ncbi:hypothetical protein NC652_034137 [Populus alba x Populus x berolinensis]|nr:hypothetical protein NC652_034137 [Populus alba x Populus x berolinensis]